MDDIAYLAHAMNDATLLRMHTQIDDWKKVQDQRYLFLACYARMTGNMLQAIPEQSFHDPAWVDTLLHRFADYYFDALRQYEESGPTPAVWHQVHTATCAHRFHPLQTLLIGVNAHINYDLVLTLYDMLSPEWKGLNEAQKQLRLEDHRQVNDIIAATIDEVQDEILEPANHIMALVDRVFGRLDEYLLSRLISKWREEVWEKAVDLLETDDLPARTLMLQELEQDVLHRSKLISFQLGGSTA